MKLGDIASYYPFSDINGEKLREKRGKGNFYLKFALL
jgi:hypothetical protein